MRTSYFPSTDNGLLAWSQNFSTRVSADPTAYGLTAGQAAQYASIHADFKAAMAGVNPGIRSRAAVSAKNTAREALKQAARPLVSIIQGTTSVTDAQKQDLGLTVRGARSAIAAPADSPCVDVVSVAGWRVNYRLHDSQSTAVRGKPRGVALAAIYSFVGDTMPTSISECKFETLNTRTTGTVTFPATIAPGTRVWLVAAWHNAKAQGGPPSRPVSTVIQFGGFTANFRSINRAA